MSRQEFKWQPWTGDANLEVTGDTSQDMALDEAQ